MAPSSITGDADSHPSSCWMRSVSFVGLQRMLRAVADAPAGGLTAKEVNEWVRAGHVRLSPSTSNPAPTTLYHYRNTLLRLNALWRDGRTLRVNRDSPHVRSIVREEVPTSGKCVLSEIARASFGELVLRNRDCRRLFLDLFTGSTRIASSVGQFRDRGSPVEWFRSSRSKEVVFRSCGTSAEVRCRSAGSIAAILYGLRYWARDELRLIDEYRERSSSTTRMFPIHWPTSKAETNSAIVRATTHLVSRCGGEEWTLVSVSDLLRSWCEAERQPVAVLFAAIDWLLQEWPHHTVAVPTSRGLATLRVGSASAERLVLRGYYRSSHGPYISHVRLHKDIEAPTM